MVSHQVRVLDRVSATQYQALSSREQGSFRGSALAVCLFIYLPYGENNDLNTSSTQSVCDLSLPSDIFRAPWRGIRLVHHNVQGLISKLPQWMQSSCEQHIVLCCSETWLSDRDPIPSLNGFVSFCSPMLKRSVGSSKFFPGSFMFVSQTLCPEHPPICEEIEQLWLCLLPDTPIIFMLIC